MSDLEQTFKKQVKRVRLRIEKLERISERYSHIRLVLVLIGIPLIWASLRFGGNRAGWIASAAVIAAFSTVLYRHGRLKDIINLHRILLDFKSTQVARMQLDWERLPVAASPPVKVEHPFAIDLDVTGEKSLHHLIDTTVSLEGSRKLCSWLTETEPDLDATLKRQKLVRELSPLTCFREKLTVNALSVRKASNEKLEAKDVLQWLKKGGSGAWLQKALLPLTLFSGCNLLILCLGLSVTGTVPWYFYALLFLYLLIMLLLQKEAARAFRDAVKLEVTLERLRAAFSHLERFGYAHTPNLAGLCAPFRNPQNRPSTQLKRIARIVSGISVRSNPVIWLLLNGAMPWDIYFVSRLEQCRKDISALLPAWLDVFTEVEALSALANFAALNPNYSYPAIEAELTKNEGAGPVAPMRFSAEQLGHPLIPGPKRISNSFFLDERNRIALITGSNMAGKSSFLRTVGINLCLAYAGAPVCARGLKTGLFRIFACMRINDSLTDGFSFFYAEVKRLRTLLSILESKSGLPVIFLLDEIFRGTNNQERFIGSRAYIRALAGHPAIGAIATHDLELVKLADENPAIINYHFREEVDEGRMLFDYKLRPGPCPTTNALKIMAMAGLPV